MASSYSDRDLDFVPYLTFSYVENYIKSMKKSSGQKTFNKGFKYFYEGYYQDLKGKHISFYISRTLNTNTSNVYNINQSNGMSFLAFELFCTFV